MTSEIVGGVTVITPGMSYLDAQNSDEFYKKALALIADSHQVVINLTHISFVDSSGLGKILALLRSARERKGTIALCNVSKSVEVLFKMVKLGQIVDIFPTVDEALSSPKFRS